VYGGTSLPGLFSLARLLRCIVIRERITLVHGHAAFRRALHSAPQPASRPRAHTPSAPQRFGK
jgi:hypothetical protein